MDLKQIGGYAFILGVIIAIIAAFVSVSWVPLVLVVLGLIVGLLNITDKETTSFLVAALALGMGSAALGPLGIPAIASIFQNIALFVAPAAFIVALLAIWKMAQG
jgi:hypothetical protein